jgi:membrane protein implicated in regulation of membrane protease activity
MSEKSHPGITMHKITFGGGFIGLLFAAGSALIFVLGFPTLWYFVAFATALGLGIAFFLRVQSRRLSNRNKPLSILAAPEQSNAQRSEPSEGKRTVFQTYPRLSSV